MSAAAPEVIRFQDVFLDRYFRSELVRARARARALRALAESLEFKLAAIDPHRDLHKLDWLSIALDEVEAAVARWFS